MTRFHVQVKGIPEIVAKLDTLAQVRPIVEDEIAHLTAVAEAAAKLNAPRDLGGLVNAIATEIKPLEGRVYILGRSVKANVAERGRGAGKKMPPIDQLAGWAGRHGFGTSRQELFVLARAIARRGIKGRFFMRKAKNAVRRQLVAVEKEMAARAEAIWSKR